MLSAFRKLTNDESAIKAELASSFEKRVLPNSDTVKNLMLEEGTFSSIFIRLRNEGLVSTEIKTRLETVHEFLSSVPKYAHLYFTVLREHPEAIKALTDPRTLDKFKASDVYKLMRRNSQSEEEDGARIFENARTGVAQIDIFVVYLRRATLSVRVSHR